MGYDGFDQQLCDNGHYNETNSIDFDEPFKCTVVQCEGEVAWSNPVDDTNYDRYGYVSMSLFECPGQTVDRLCFSWAGTELIPVKTYRHPEDELVAVRQAVADEARLQSLALERNEILEVALTEMLTLKFVWPKWKSISLDPFVECPGCYCRQPLEHNGDFEWEPVGPIEHARSCPSHLLTCKKHG
jgi:hypothetical protein|tara:strand:- start:1094 stop:1651 length:558 start_codon:yes stop_codon:yes gene_type:complete